MYLMSLVRERGLQPLVQYDVPFKGTFRSSAIHKVPSDAVYNGLNIFTREGKLRTRAGMRLLDGFIFDDKVIGGAMAVGPTGKNLLAITQTCLYERQEQAETWTQTAGFDFSHSFTINDRNMVDIAFIDTSGQLNGVIASIGRPLKVWNAVTHQTTVMAPTGDAPIPMAKSVCIAARRLVCLTDPYTLDWSKVFDITYFSGLTRNRIAQTSDVGICVRALSSLSFVLYKERSIIPVRAQAGNDDTAFSFAEPLKVEGPAGLHAVVDVGGSHIYMTKNGRIAIFDGTSYPQWILDGLWLFLQKDIDPAQTDKIFGVFDYRLHTVTFYYPKVGYAGALQGMVIINLSFEDMPMHAFLGLCTKSPSFGYEMRFNDQIDRSLVFAADVDNQVYYIDEDYNRDENDSFDCYFQTGLQGMTDARHGRIVLESFLERGHGYGQIVIEPVLSDGLEDKEGRIPDLSGQIENLEFNPVIEYRGFGDKTRFFGFKYSWQSTSKVRFAGAVAYGKI